MVEHINFAKCSVYKRPEDGLVEQIKFLVDNIYMTYSCTLNNPTFEEEITNIYLPQLKNNRKQRVDYHT